MLKSAYRAFAKECYLIIELMRQFYDEERIFRITGKGGESEFVRFSGEVLRARPAKVVGGVELGSREPVFDIVVSAEKKSTFSRLSQNETAKECYQLGFFAPANADAALAALEMMDFEGIEKVRQRVRQNGTLVVLIGLRTATEEQMTLYYQNLFRILCGLVETALVRAFEYENAVRESWYLPGTCLLRPAVFAQKLESACTLQEDKMAHHLLLRVTGEFKNQADLNAGVERSIRSTDVAGVGSDNAIYLLMNQAEEANLPLLTKRMGEKGLHVISVPLDEQLRLVSAAKQEV